MRCNLAIGLKGNFKKELALAMLDDRDNLRDLEGMLVDRNDRFHRARNSPRAR